MNPAITLKNLTFTHQGRTQYALAGVDLSVVYGHTTTVMGHAGCGKSSLCMSLNGLIPKFLRGEMGGRVVIDGRDVTQCTTRELAETVGLVFQDFESQLVCTGVEQEVAFGPENYGVPRKELWRRVDKYLALTKLAGVRSREQASLSGGQRQLLAVASVLSLETPILVMDGPMSDLDPVTREEVVNIARQAAKDGRCVIMVDQEPEAAMGTDQIALMKAGQVVAHDRADKLLRQPKLMEECGIRPPQLAELFQLLKSSELPVTVDEALGLLLEARRSARWRPESGTHSLASSPILEARGVSYVYREGNIEALQRLSLQVHQGEFLAILGQNGSGKTTLGKLLSGLLRPTEGTVLVEGESTTAKSRRALAQLVGYVFQNPDCQIFAPTVYEEVSFGPRNFRLSESEIKIRVAGALEVVGLNGLEQHDPFALTKGQRQRVAVASILVSRPKVLILDEPTTGLDYRQQRSMMDLLTRLNQAGHTVIIITHSMWVAAEYGTRSIVMRDGAVLLDGPTRDVFAHEEVLAQANLRPPPIAQLGQRLGIRALSVQEMVWALGA